MTTQQKSEYEKLGEAILKGNKIGEIFLKGKRYKLDYTKEEFTETARGIHRGGQDPWPDEFIEEVWKDYKNFQSDFISDFHSDFCLASGGFGSGKSFALYMKMILMCKCFPNNRVLLGRKTISDIERASLPDIFELMPPSWYQYKVKEGVINFTNGSQIILFGLDAMQSGGMADIKKAEQKLKSLNLGAYFIDQLEEVEESVIVVLNSRLRRTNVPFRQGNMTTNPANYWAYDQYVANPRKGHKLYQSSMLFNPNLPWDYIRKQLGMGEDYVNRFVKGIWNTDSLLKGSVFAKEHIRYLETLRRSPVAIENECEIYEQPMRGQEYRIGVDPSEGVIDPGSISVVSLNGKKVAKFNGKLPIIGLADKVKFLYYKYGKPLIIPESNAAGAALIREIRDLRVYKRKELESRWDKESEKLGFRMSHSSKQQLISHFNSLLRDGLVKIFDEKTTEEMKAFIWSNEATQQGAGAPRGFHDDEVISTMLAFWEFKPKKIEEYGLMMNTKKLAKKKTFQYN